MKKNNYIYIVLFIVFTVVIFFPSIVFAIDYNNPCSGDILKAMKVLSKILVVLKIIVPLLIIIFGMIDFGKAVISSDEKAISTSTKTLIKRFIAGVIIFIIPTLVLAIMDVIHLSDEVSSFEACTACLLNSDRCN